MKKPLEYDPYNLPRDPKTITAIFDWLGFRDAEGHSLTSMADFQTLVKGYCQIDNQTSPTTKSPS